MKRNRKGSRRSDETDFDGVLNILFKKTINGQSTTTTTTTTTTMMMMMTMTTIKDERTVVAVEAAAEAL
uniref:Uncharacterized protein n=1 Tax=Syphacia muris TaxID=451379 RepID=A0A0N5ASW0_9BILA